MTTKISKTFRNNLRDKLDQALMSIFENIGFRDGIKPFIYKGCEEQLRNENKKSDSKKFFH